MISCVFHLRYQVFDGISKCNTCNDNGIYDILRRNMLSSEKTSMNMGPCHHGMARPQVADEGMASYMESSRE